MGLDGPSKNKEKNITSGLVSQQSCYLSDNQRAINHEAAIVTEFKNSV
jgi:hypothetical protein